MKKTMVYLPDDMHRFLVREAAERGSSMAQVTRDAIDQYRMRATAQQEKRVSALFGVLADKDSATDMALHVDDVLDSYYGESGAFEVGDSDACSD